MSILEKRLLNLGNPKCGGIRASAPGLEGVIAYGIDRTSNQERTTVWWNILGMQCQ